MEKIISLYSVVLLCPLDHISCGDDMPSHVLHRLVSKSELGREYSSVHKLMDLPVLVKGSGHREFFHSVNSQVGLFSLMALFPDDKKMEAALLHILLDEVCTKHPELAFLLQFYTEKNK